LEIHNGQSITLHRTVVYDLDIDRADTKRHLFLSTFASVRVLMYIYHVHTNLAFLPTDPSVLNDTATAALLTQLLRSNIVSLSMIEKMFRVVTIAFTGIMNDQHYRDILRVEPYTPSEMGNDA